MKLGEKMRTFRVAKGLSQENIASQLGISATAYAKIERGETDVNFSRLEQIAKIFEVSTLDLIGFSGSSLFYKSHMSNNSNLNNSLNAVVPELPIENAKLKAENEGLKKEVEHLKKIIDLLEKQVK
jgi:transcriptional regulator with XRE-family HTH domain